MVALVPCLNFSLLYLKVLVFFAVVIESHLYSELYVLVPFSCLRVTIFDPICLGIREICLFLIYHFDDPSGEISDDVNTCEENKTF